MIELDEDGVSETEEFVLVTPIERIGLTDLPLSPRKLYKTVEAMDWEVHAWLAIGWVAPTVYAASKGDHAAGEEKAEGFTALLYTVEARDPASREIGFQAHFLGKRYDSDKKGQLGSFTHARIKDPVGIPRQTRFFYKTTKPSRGKFETEKSYKVRLDDAEKFADMLNYNYNDGSTYWLNSLYLTTAGDLDSWLAEWKGFIS